MEANWRISRCSTAAERSTGSVSPARRTLGEHNASQPSQPPQAQPHTYAERKRRAWPWTCRRARGGRAARACSSSAVCGRASCSTTASCGSASTARAPSGSRDPHRSGWPPDALGSTCPAASAQTATHMPGEGLWKLAAMCGGDPSKREHAAGLVFTLMPCMCKEGAR